MAVHGIVTMDVSAQQESTTEQNAEPLCGLAAKLKIIKMKDDSKTHLIPHGSEWLTISQASKLTRGEIEQGYVDDPETIYGLVKAIRILLKEKKNVEVSSSDKILKRLNIARG